MMTDKMNALKLKLIRWVCDLQDEVILQKLIDTVKEAQKKER